MKTAQKFIYIKWIKGKKYPFGGLALPASEYCLGASICFATWNQGNDNITNIRYGKKICPSNFRQSHIPGSKRKRVFHALVAF